MVLTSTLLMLAATPAAPPPDPVLRQLAETRKFKNGTPNTLKMDRSGAHVFFLRSSADSPLQSLHVFDVDAGQARELLSAEALLKGAAQQLSPAERAQLERQRVAARGVISYELSADGRTVIVPVSGRLYRVDVAGLLGGRTVEQSVKVLSPSGALDAKLSPDGKLLVFQQRGDIYSVDVETAGGAPKPVPLVQTSANEHQAHVSPDGKWLTYESDETGRSEIYIKSFPEGPGKWQVSTDGGQGPRWRGDGKELFFLRAPDIVAIDIVIAGGSVQPGVPRSLFGTANPNLLSGHSTDYFRYAVTPDGQRFLLPQPPSAVGPDAAPGARGGGGGLAQVLIAAADADSSASSTAGANSVTVVLNWPSIIKTDTKQK